MEKIVGRIEHFRKLLLDYWSFASFGDNKNSGGVVTFVSKRVAPRSDLVMSEELVAGRVLKVTILSPHGSDSGRQVIYNVHNFGLSNPQVKQVCDKIEVDINEMSPTPLTHSLFLLGDFNICHQEKFSYSAPAVTTMDSSLADERPADSVTGFRQFSRVFEQLVEINPRLPTRYDTRSGTGRAIDRVFMNTPSAMCPLNLWEITLPYCPRDLFVAGISDHAPVVVSIAFRGVSSAEALPIPPEVTGSLLYKIFLDHIAWEDRLTSLEGFEKLVR